MATKKVTEKQILIEFEKFKKSLYDNPKIFTPAKPVVVYLVETSIL